MFIGAELTQQTGLAHKLQDLASYSFLYVFEIQYTLEPDHPGLLYSRAYTNALSRSARQTGLEIVSQCICSIYKAFKN
jgi:hypothetical protein